MEGAIAWSLSGDDSGDFSLAGESAARRVLNFQSSPNYENPTDEDTDNQYDVTIQASDGANTSSLQVVVSVTNVRHDPDELPVITGTARVGETLTVDTSPIRETDENTTFGYAWIRTDGGTDTTIEGANSSSYTLTDTDEGNNIKVQLGFRTTSSEFLYLISAPTEVVAKPNTAATGAPTISGTAQVDQTLTADTSPIDDEDGLTKVSYRYQWIAGGSDIDGATGFSYELTSSEQGQAIQVRVTFTDDRNNAETLTSVATGAVAVRPNPLAGFTLVDASAQPQTVLATLTGGEALTLDDPANGSYGIRVNTQPGTDIVSVRLELTGGKSVDQTEGIAPYSLYGDNGESNLHGEDLPVGSYTLTATAYSEGSLGGEELGILTVSFTVAKANSPATGSPTISGTQQVGQTLTADTSEIDDADGLTNVSYEYRWTASKTVVDENTGTSFPVIALLSGDTSSTYTLAPADAGYTFQIRVTFTDDEGNNESLISQATEAVAATVPTAPLALTVTPGSQIQELEASWQAPSSNGGSAVTGYKVQWKEAADSWDTAADVSEATETGTTHTITGLTGGVEYAVRVMATNDAGDGPASTEAKGTPAGDVSEQTVEPENTENTVPTGLPSIGGTPQVDQTLTADTSPIDDGDGLTNVSYGYQWIADGTDIEGATSSTYTLTYSQQGQAIRVRVTFTDDDDNEETLTSEATVAVAAAPNHRATGAPTVSGTPQVDETLTADTANIADQDGLTGVSYRYQWSAGGADIEGATGSTYILTASEQGQTIQVKVTFTDDRNNQETLTSEATVEVAAAPAPLTASLPDSRFQSARHNGAGDRPQVIAAFSLPVASFEKTTPSVSLTGTTVSSVRLHEEDGLQNSWIFFLDPDGDADIVFSLATGQPCDSGGICTEDGTTLSAAPEPRVLPGPDQQNNPPTGLPSISGTPQVDQTLTADTSPIDDSDGLTNVSYRYQWIAGGSDIDGATGSSFTLTASQQGQTIQVKVSFTDDRNNAEALTSEPTGAVAAKPIPLTATFTNVPTSHGGSGATFTFDLAFSENVKISYVNLRDHAFAEDGGEVDAAQRKVPGSNQTWTITVKPDGNGTVTITLPETTNCGDQGAICTKDDSGRKLSNSLSFTVSGPGQ